MVFAKLEQQTSGMIVRTFLTALLPSLTIDKNTKAKITNGSEKVSHSLRPRLSA
jgi:hypothetical protein